MQAFLLTMNGLDFDQQLVFAILSGRASPLLLVSYIASLG